MLTIVDCEVQFFLHSHCYDTCTCKSLAGLIISMSIIFVFSIYEKLIEFIGIDEKGSNYPPVSTSFSSNSFRIDV